MGIICDEAGRGPKGRDGKALPGKCIDVFGILRIGGDDCIPGVGFKKTVLTKGP